MGLNTQINYAASAFFYIVDKATHEAVEFNGVSFLGLSASFASTVGRGCSTWNGGGSLMQLCYEPDYGQYRFKMHVHKVERLFFVGSITFF